MQTPGAWFLVSGRSWYSKDLGDAMLAGEALAEIAKQFDAARVNAGSPGDMAVFLRHESDGSLHCRVMLYMSPSASLFASTILAQPCEPPASAGLGLLAGSEEAWSLLFPDHQR